MFPGTSKGIAIAIGAIIVIAYTFMGGYKAVCWTDFVQGLLMVVVVVVVPLAAMGHLGGWSEVSTALDNVGFDNYLNLFYAEGEAMSAVVIISLLAWGLGYFGMPHILVRYMSIRNPEEVKVARRVSLVWIVIALAAAIMIGIVGRAYYMEVGPVAGFEDQEIFILMAGDLFPSLIAGFLFAAVMAAIMSTADSQLLVASSAIANDVLGKSKRFNLSENTLMWVSRGVVILIAIIAFFISLYGGSDIMSLVDYAWAGFGAAFGPLMILSLFWKRMNLQGAIASMVVGALVIILCEVFTLEASTGIYSLLPGFFIALIVGVVVALATPGPSKEIEDEFDAAQVYEEPMQQ